MEPHGCSGEPVQAGSPPGTCASPGGSACLPSTCHACHLQPQRLAARAQAIPCGRRDARAAGAAAGAGGERLELLVSKTDNLQADSSVFRRQSKALRQKLWWQSARTLLLLGLLLAGGLFVVVTAFCGITLKACRTPLL